MRKTFYLKILFILFSFQLSAQAPLASLKTDKVLEKKLQSLVNDFQGVVGIYVKHLKKNTGVAIQADTIFPTAVADCVAACVASALICSASSWGELSVIYNYYITLNFANFSISLSLIIQI